MLIHGQSSQLHITRTTHHQARITRTTHRHAHASHARNTMRTQLPAQHHTLHHQPIIWSLPISHTLCLTYSHLLTELVGDIQLQKLRTFVDMYTRQLRDYEEALDESLSEVSDSSADPVALFIQPHEQAEMTQLAKTDNKIFTKVMSVFGTLCNQIRMLRETVSPSRSFPFTCLHRLLHCSSPLPQLILNSRLRLSSSHHWSCLERSLVRPHQERETSKCK